MTWRNRFSGSVTAVDRALAERQSVVCCDTNDSPWLGVRPSVRLGGIRALVCVPLQIQGDAMGVVYADSRKPGPPITELDLELISNIGITQRRRSPRGSCRVMLQNSCRPRRMPA